MAKQYLLRKADFDTFINSVLKRSEVIAPVKGDETKLRTRSRYAPITSPDEIWLEGIPFYTTKYFFFDRKEVLFKFKGNEVIDPTITLKDRVFFGVRPCDLQGIRHQDIVFLEENPDPFYKARREATLLIGLQCAEDGNDEFCFCGSLDLKDIYFDLMLYDKDDAYAVVCGSDKGTAFIERYEQYFEATEGVITPSDVCTKDKRGLATTDIADIYDRDEWKEGADRCISCGACTMLCPSCHCFTIQDELDLDLKSGQRVRTPASCQLMSFTRVAGDHVFRSERLARFKHRIYHQLQYSREHRGETLCIGCGRCVRDCPAKIDWVSIINKMKEGDKDDDA